MITDSANRHRLQQAGRRNASLQLRQIFVPELFARLKRVRPNELQVDLAEW